MKGAAIAAGVAIVVSANYWLFRRYHRKEVSRTTKVILAASVVIFLGSAGFLEASRSTGAFPVELHFAPPTGEQGRETSVFAKGTSALAASQRLPAPLSSSTPTSIGPSISATSSSSTAVQDSTQPVAACPEPNPKTLACTPWRRTASLEEGNLKVAWDRTCNLKPSDRLICATIGQEPMARFKVVEEQTTGLQFDSLGSCGAEPDADDALSHIDLEDDPTFGDIDRASNNRHVGRATRVLISGSCQERKRTFGGDDFGDEWPTYGCEKGMTYRAWHCAYEKKIERLAKR
jgi:hypothetical protein